MSEKEQRLGLGSWGGGGLEQGLQGPEAGWGQWVSRENIWGLGTQAGSWRWRERTGKRPEPGGTSSGRGHSGALWDQGFILKEGGDRKQRRDTFFMPESSPSARLMARAFCLGP